MTSTSGRRLKEQDNTEARSDFDGAGLTLKVRELENTLKRFRSEVDMKMNIVEQILSTRNEQFVVQKKLLEKDHSLYETLLSHWKDTVQLASDGLSLQFCTPSEDIQTPPDVVDPYQTSASRRRQRRRMARKRVRIDNDEDSGAIGLDDGGVLDSHSDGSQSNEMFGEEGDLGGDDVDDAVDEGMEEKVFVDFTAEKAGRNPSRIWTYFLREENGKSALCKLCDDNDGVQTILKTYQGGTFSLHRHLRTKHKVSTSQAPPPETIRREANDQEDEDLSSMDASRGRSAGNENQVKSNSFNPIWNFFKNSDEDKKLAVCFCNTRISRGTIGHGSTTKNMVKHLKRKHDTEYKTFSEQKKAKATGISPAPPSSGVTKEYEDDDLFPDLDDSS